MLQHGHILNEKKPIIKNCIIIWFQLYERYRVDIHIDKVGKWLPGARENGKWLLGFLLGPVN